MERKMFKKCKFGENTKKKIIIITLLRMNLASDHLNKDRILFLRSKTIKMMQFSYFDGKLAVNR